MSKPFVAEAARCRAAQIAWSLLPVSARLTPVTAFRHLIAARADELTAAAQADVGRRPGEVVATDLLPTAAAAKYLARHADRLLAPRRARGRPLWLLGTRDTIHRRPHGVVGLISTWNYPVFLAAVPLLHATAAGNGVLWKPSELAPRSAAVLAALLGESGFPADLIVPLPATREGGEMLAEADIDFVHFTGSGYVGQKLAMRLAARQVPSVLELSGCDAAFVLPGADATFAARCAWYAATLNGGQTCMATRVAFVARELYPAFIAALRDLVACSPAYKLASPMQGEQLRLVRDGYRPAGAENVIAPAAGDGVAPMLILNATMSMVATCSATFLPLLSVIPVDSAAEAFALHGRGGDRLTAAVFAATRAEGEAFASRLPVGMVTVNDAIAPTAHPGTPFGGRRGSGWGVTQGDEGLLQMTVPQVISARRGTFRPHVDAHLDGTPGADDVTRGLLRMTHAAGWRERWRGLRQMLGGLRRGR